ncbi:PREDICTED: pentatricopeptide repeat-containing protein At5g66520-like [Fragaria vesca subsp. vesca]|uniref:pentatricopeptide repeat-containing protein At5g66520-like n=1 Tax=Fragaria vesca subsp. vesca TaxID=101020 RepID=UPI0002C34979|nr:PREDICTED: pentatricopeptide repeat-containing protein At5g66520-like [Fragaria vesca subsp. vesca]XP_011461222.1 PREDICTED: pentatricopeptide repeat-containing protein At5g66520-like [Fragaria vesca subsp. vesca]XP_011461223.1 PREDICTED: pentatricopeptide repeat-containing protein At5g66520-like [Fragaria vesca subsp. vesca]XP_011461224.1 PREDICTED: pentatricopeptide repeat-containing protein At5g66520-like [Fragaria vesca subsp. vesca]
MNRASKRALSLLDQCLTMAHIKQVQSHLAVSGTLFDPYAAAKVISFCALSHNPHHLRHAYHLFRFMPTRTTYIWNLMIRTFTDSNDPTQALSLYTNMLRTGSSPDNYTFSFALRASAALSSLYFGVMIHTHAIRLGWESYDFVQNGLVHLYVTCESMDSARKLFDMCFCKDVVTWTALVNGYVKCGQIVTARHLFDEMPEKNAVSWSTMINGFVHLGMFREALEVFADMQAAGVSPNRAGIVGALTACGYVGALDQGRWIHAYVKRKGMRLDVVLGTAVVDMYAKCGCVETSCAVFDEMRERDVFAFTSLISGFANNGECVNAVSLFKRMEDEGVAPNEVTFVCVLSACSRVGMVDEGLKVFRSMKSRFGVEPGVQHYGCLVDLLGRAGMLEEAKKVVTKMPMGPDSYVLGALLNACRVHGDLDLGKEMVERFTGQRLDHSGVHVLLSNIYASENQWDDVTLLRKGMEEKRVRKVPGCSLIEVNGEVYECTAGDRSHMLMQEIMLLSFATLKHLKSFWFDGDDK